MTFPARSFITIVHLYPRDSPHPYRRFLRYPSTFFKGDSTLRFDYRSRARKKERERGEKGTLRRNYLDRDVSTRHQRHNGEPHFPALFESA